MLVLVAQHSNRANCIKDSNGNDIVMTTDSNGDTNQVELEPGTYWARETKCAKGYGENPDDANNPPQVSVVSGQTTTFETTDPPQNDPVGMLLGKVDTETTKNLPLGAATFKDAQFEVM